MTSSILLSAGSLVWRRRGSARGAACLGVLCVMLLGLYAFPGSAGQDPYHIHIVIGGTPAERARALVFHLLHEREGIDTAELPLMPGSAGRFPGVHVFSVHGTDTGGAAVLSAETSGAVLLAAIPQVPVPSQTSWTPPFPLAGIPQTAPPTPEPPPRDV